MKYKYQIIYQNDSIPQDTEWHFVALLENGKMLFEKVIQGLPETFTLPQDNNTYTQKQPTTNTPVTTS